MKKVLALVLALSLALGFATAALADDPAFTFSEDPFAYVDGATGDSDNESYEPLPIPGESFYFEVTTGGTIVKQTSGDPLKNYRLTYKAEEGGSLVESVKLVAIKDKYYDGDRCYYVRVTLKDTLKLYDEPQNVKLTFQLVGIKDGLAPSEVKTFQTAVEYDRTKADESFFLIDEYSDKNRYRTAGESDAGRRSGEHIEFADYSADEWMPIEMTAGRNSEVLFESRIFKQQDLLLRFDSSIVDRYEEAYGGSAALSYYWFTQPRAFRQPGTLSIQVDAVEINPDDPYPEGQQYRAPHLYEEVDGQLVELKDKYDMHEEKFILEDVRTLGKYVVSDVDLGVTAAGGPAGGEAAHPEQNPETGGVLAGACVLQLAVPYMR